MTQEIPEKYIPGKAVEPTPEVKEAIYKGLVRMAKRLSEPKPEYVPQDRWDTIIVNYKAHMKKAMDQGIWTGEDLEVIKKAVE